MPADPLVAYCVITLVGLLLTAAIAYDRPARPTPRIVGRPRTTWSGRSSSIDTTPRPAWLDRPDDTVTWTYRAGQGDPRRMRRLRTYNAFAGTTFGDPPPAVFARQARPTLTGSVAAAWDQWHHRTTWHATTPVVLPPVDPDPIEVAA